jgi:hypothetical protein
VKAYQLELDYMKACTARGTTGQKAEFDEELGMVFEDFRSIQGDLKGLKRQRGNLEEEIGSSKHTERRGMNPILASWKGPTPTRLSQE